ncbi:sulfate transporter N-terminal domain with GLY motif-domain-containing protein [Cunninghamella echinulata]|nr:sulfate transporter N-terminal domain with GLY motif-domain-containing protein [Cunninghamella echinulata]
MDTIIIDYQPEPYKKRIHNRCLQIPSYLSSYILSFFPIIQWVYRYNLAWLFQDVIAGVTVGMITVPQSIAYSKIANLDPQYGLYSSFVGVILYVIFGTSKDISLGLISVVCLLVGNAIQDVTSLYPDITGPQVAITISLFTGIIMSVIGMIRLGIIVDFIPGK